jgi:hypothetical protein
MRTPIIIANIKAMHSEGHSNWAILEYVTSEGIEFCDASYLVSRILRLDSDEVLEMEENYI